MVRQTVILVTRFIILAFSYEIFILMSVFTTICKYYFRIAYIFMNKLLRLEMILLLKFTKPLKTSIMERRHRRTNMVIPAVI